VTSFGVEDAEADLYCINCSLHSPSNNHSRDENSEIWKQLKRHLYPETKNPAE